MITCHGANSIWNFLVFHKFYFGARWVRALEFRARYFPILAQNVIFSGEKFRKKSCKLIKLQLKFKRAPPTRAKIKAMKNYKNLDAICTMNRDHISKIEQIHPNRTTCTKSILILKITDFQEFQGTFNKKSRRLMAFIFFLHLFITLYYIINPYLNQIKKNHTNAQKSPCFAARMTARHHQYHLFNPP